MSGIISSGNVERAHRAEQTIEYYNREHLCEDDFPISDAEIIDLLTDIRHYCKIMNYDFESIIRMSEIHYEAEEKGEE